MKMDKCGCGKMVNYSNKLRLAAEKDEDIVEKLYKEKHNAYHGRIPMKVKRNGY